MLALRIIEHLDIIEYVPSSCCAGGIDLPPDSFAFQELKGGLCDSIVVTISAPAHAGFQIVLFQKRQPLATGKLAILIKMGGDFFSVDCAAKQPSSKRPRQDPLSSVIASTSRRHDAKASQ
jgi:hypothetical protein